MQTQSRRVPAALVATLILEGLAACGGTPAVDCGGVTIEAVRDAIANVSGYEWELSGMDQVATTIVQDRAIAYEYEDVVIEAIGAYLAPDRGVWEVPAGVPQPPQHSSVFDLWQPDTDAYLRIGDDVWLSRMDSAHYYQATDVNLLVPNVLLPILDLQPMAIDWPDAPWSVADDTNIAWQTSTDDGACALSGALGWPSGAPSLAEGFKHEVRARVDPDSRLPSSVTLEADWPAGTTGAFGWAYEATWSITYDRLPQIEAPADPASEPAPHPESPGPM